MMGKEPTLDPQALKEAVERAVPGWTWTAGSIPKRFGWAPDRHYRGILRRGKHSQAVVVRKAWSARGYATEVFMYRDVLPKLRLRTPALLATFQLPDDANGWTILSDAGTSVAQSGRKADRRAFLHALGTLHAEGLVIVQHDALEPLAVFGKDALYDPPEATWADLLQEALPLPGLGLNACMLSLNDCVRQRLAEDVMTLIHNDTDFSNAVMTADGLVLLDWERAAVGPPALDLGRATETCASFEEMTSYRQGFDSVQPGYLAEEMLREWSDLGEAYNALRWICYYVWHVLRAPTAPPKAWMDHSYYPFLTRLERIRQRRPTWSR